MKKYKVRVSTSAIEFWMVEAKSEQEAMDNYMEGENYFTKPKGEDVEIMGEVNENVQTEKQIATKTEIFDIFQKYLNLSDEEYNKMYNETWADVDVTIWNFEKNIREEK